MKKYIFIVLMIMNLSCSKVNRAVTFYDNIVVTSIEKDSENPKNLRIALGISAQVFYLSPKTENYPELLKILSQSYEEQQQLKVGIENNTNQIKFVQPKK